MKCICFTRHQNKISAVAKTLISNIFVLVSQALGN